MVEVRGGGVMVVGASTCGGRGGGGRRGGGGGGGRFPSYCRRGHSIRIRRELKESLVVRLVVHHEGNGLPALHLSAYGGGRE